MGEMHGAALRFQPDPDVGIMVCALISFHHRDFGRMVRADLFYFFIFSFLGRGNCMFTSFSFLKKKIWVSSSPPPPLLSGANYAQLMWGWGSWKRRSTAVAADDPR